MFLLINLNHNQNSEQQYCLMSCSIVCMNSFCLKSNVLHLISFLFELFYLIHVYLKDSSRSQRQTLSSSRSQVGSQNFLSASLTHLFLKTRKPTSLFYSEKHVLLQLLISDIQGFFSCFFILPPTLSPLI